MVRAPALTLICAVLALGAAGFGMWATHLDTGEPGFSAIFAAKDIEAAKTALPRLAGSKEISKRSYEDVDYLLDEEDGRAYGVVDDFVVPATEGAFKRTVGTRDG